MSLALVSIVLAGCVAEPEPSESIGTTHATHGAGAAEVDAVLTPEHPIAPSYAMTAPLTVPRVILAKDRDIREPAIRERD